MARSKAEKARLAVGRHTWREELKPWAEPLEYESWKAIVCGQSYAHDDVLREFYAAQWDAEDCREYMLVEKILGAHPKPPVKRVVTLDDAAVNRRFAKALWRECNALLTRRMTPSARQLVVAMSARTAAQAGLES